MIDMIDGVAFEKDQQMTYISSGVVCSLYSNDLTQQEKLTVIKYAVISGYGENPIFYLKKEI